MCASVDCGNLTFAALLLRRPGILEQAAGPAAVGQPLTWLPCRLPCGQQATSCRDRHALHAAALPDVQVARTCFRHRFKVINSGSGAVQVCSCEAAHEQRFPPS